MPFDPIDEEPLDRNEMWSPLEKLAAQAVGDPSVPLLIPCEFSFMAHYDEPGLPRIYDYRHCDEPALAPDHRDRPHRRATSRPRTTTTATATATTCCRAVHSAARSRNSSSPSSADGCRPSTTATSAGSSSTGAARRACRAEPDTAA